MQNGCENDNGRGFQLQGGDFIWISPNPSVSLGRKHRGGHMMHRWDTYHFCEVFAGQGAVSRGLTAKGYRCFMFDVRRNAQHNFHTPQGLRVLAEALARTLPKGAVMLEPTCGSWIYISTGGTLRHLEPGLEVYLENALIISRFMKLQQQCE